MTGVSTGDRSGPDMEVVNQIKSNLTGSLTLKRSRGTDVTRRRKYDMFINWREGDEAAIK